VPLRGPELQACHVMARARTAGVPRRPVAPLSAQPTLRGRTAPSAVFKPNCAFKAPRCLGGHELLITVCRVGGKVCNCCMQPIPSTYTHRCHGCDYDLCRRCFSTEGDELAAVARSESALSQPVLAAASGADLPEASYEAQLRQYQDYRRAQGASEQRLAEECAQLVEELRRHRVPALASEVLENDSEHGFASMPLDAALPEPYPFENQMAFDMDCLPPWCFPSWRTSRHRPMLEQRTYEVQRVYGKGVRRRQAPIWVSQGPPAQLQPSPRITHRSHASEPSATAGGVSPALFDNNVTSISAAGCFAGDIRAAASTFAAMGLPSSEQWRAECAESVARSVGHSRESRRASPRTSSTYKRHPKSKLGPGMASMLRPCVDDLQGGFGRSQWEFD